MGHKLTEVSGCGPREYFICCSVVDQSSDIGSRDNDMLVHKLR